MPPGGRKRPGGPDRNLTLDKFGPLGIRPTAGTCWARMDRPGRQPAAFYRTNGVACFHALPHNPPLGGEAQGRRWWSCSDQQGRDNSY